MEELSIEIDIEDFDDFDIEESFKEAYGIKEVKELPKDVWEDNVIEEPVIEVLVEDDSIDPRTIEISSDKYIPDGMKTILKEEIEITETIKPDEIIETVKITEVIEIETKETPSAFEESINDFTIKNDPDKLYFNSGKEYLGIAHYNNLSGEEQFIEMMKCKMSVLYWVEHYAYAPVTGGGIHLGTSEQWKSSGKFPLLFKLFDQLDTTQLLSSRQIGKTTMALMYGLWAMIFYKGIDVMFLTLSSELAKDAVVRMTTMMAALPKWMQVKNSSAAAKTTFIDLVNGSKFKTSFISGVVDPNKAGRGFSFPILICDEFAFCNHAEIVFSAMQPALATARMHAKKNGYPSALIMVSTPNGAGTNTFYNILQNSVKIDDIYDFKNKKMFEGYQKEFERDMCNGYVSVTIHWSETHRDDEWYKQQCRDLNFNKRRINQELDLAFLGSSSSIFSDDVIGLLKAKKSEFELQLPYGQVFKMFGEIDPNELYLLGCDSSASTGASSDFSALSLIQASTGQEVGIWKGQYAVVKKLSYTLKVLVKGLAAIYGLTEDTLMVIIERNSFGKGVVEELVYNDPVLDDFDYRAYVWQDQYKDGEYVYGFWTGNAGKMGAGRRDQMFSELMNHVNGYPELIHSNELINDLRGLVETSSGRIEAGRGSHDDCVMANSFCLFVRRQMIKKGEIVVDGDIVVFQLTPETMAQMIDVTFSNKYSELSDADEAIIKEDNLEVESYRTKRLKRKKEKLDKFDISDYFIGM